MQYPRFTLRQAGERLKGMVAANTGPYEHLWVANACINAKTLEDAVVEVAPNVVHQIDVDDAVSFVSQLMNGEFAVTDQEAESLRK